MIVGDNYVFIHLQKTGGTYLGDFLRKFVNGRDYLGEHSLGHKIKSSDMNKLKFGVIRNPYSWAVSHYHYQKQHKNRLFGYLGKPPTFKAYLHRIYDGDKMRKIFKQDLPTLNYDNFLELDIGVLTFRYILFFCDKPIKLLNDSTKETLFDNVEDAFIMDRIIKMENFCGEVVDIFEELETPLSEKAKEEICSGKKSNTSKHNHYTTYYNDNLIELVKNKDRYILDKYGYDFK